ncbi:MAG: restriction endonuclease subunit S [Mycoplasmatales bacterium]
MAIYRLGDIASIRIGKTPSTGNNKYWYNGEISWYNGENLSKKSHNCKKITKYAVDNNNQPLTTSNSLLLSMVRYIEPFIPLTNASFNQGVACIEPYDILKREFLYYWLENNKKMIKKNLTSGSTFPSINSSDIKTIKLNLPSLKQQQEIIDIIKPIEEAINNLDKQIEEVKKTLSKKYECLDNVRVGFSEYIELYANKYSGQENYLATNAVGEFTMDTTKEQNIIDNRPSRANLTPIKNSIIISKLNGENKILYIDDMFSYVVSTGFFNFTSEYLDHVVGFLLSEDFKKQKTLLSTGTTMVGLNNTGLNKIFIGEPSEKSDKIVKFLNTLIRNKLELKKELNKVILLLVK